MDISLRKHWGTNSRLAGFRPRPGVTLKLFRTLSVVHRSDANVADARLHVFVAVLAVDSDLACVAERALLGNDAG